MLPLGRAGGVRDVWHDDFIIDPAMRAIPYVDVQATNRRAYVTMAAGNAAGAMATALIRSLLDTGTDPRKIDIVVLLVKGGRGSPECPDPEWRATMGLSSPARCASGAETVRASACPGRLSPAAPHSRLTVCLASF